MELKITCDTHSKELLVLSKPGIVQAELEEYLASVSCEEACTVYGVVYGDEDQELFGADKPSLVPEEAPVEPPARPWWRFW